MKFFLAIYKGSDESVPKNQHLIAERRGRLVVLHFPGGEYYVAPEDVVAVRNEVSEECFPLPWHETYTDLTLPPTELVEWANGKTLEWMLENGGGDFEEWQVIAFYFWRMWLSQETKGHVPEDGAFVESITVKASQQWDLAKTLARKLGPMIQDDDEDEPG
ncbi:MAG: hypothetical protein M1570_03080 [Chloroflexi bacterium]|nr:hypothetical protein [Chloroflexota bacterium]